MGIAQRIGRRIAPRAGDLAPGPTAEIIHQALHRAIHGIGPLDGARTIAEKELKDQGGDVERAVNAVVNAHVGWSGAQGFLTNLGGLVTLAATVPANISGLALLQCRMVAAIAHLRGYDLDDSRVRNAVLATLLGEDAVKDLVRKKRLPGTPRHIASLPADQVVPAAAPANGKKAPRPELDRVVGSQVATALLANVGGKRLATMAGKRIPVVGGVIGAGTDAWATRQVGGYARKQLTAR